MKETEKIIEDKIEIVGQREVSSEIRFIGSVKNLNRGLTCFEIDYVKNTIFPAEFKQELVFDANAIGKIRPVKKIITKNNCFYVMALNKKNAFKQFLKHVNNR